jgi:hypothetical protein
LVLGGSVDNSNTPGDGNGHGHGSGSGHGSGGKIHKESGEGREGGDDPSPRRSRGSLCLSTFSGPEPGPFPAPCPG